MRQAPEFSLTSPARPARRRSAGLPPHAHSARALKAVAEKTDDDDIQPDFFVGRGASANLSFRDDIALMAYPFFSLQKQARHEPLEYSDERTQTRIRVTGGPKGIATIWDKDVLLYCSSLINDALEKGLPVSRRMRLCAHDLLRATGRSTGKDGYQALSDALFRLRSTTIVTNITANSMSYEGGFGWIDNYRIVRRELGAKARKEAAAAAAAVEDDGVSTAGAQGRMAALEIVLNEWTFQSIVRDRRVLRITPEYFQLSRALERRLYELARKHCGSQPFWKIRLPLLAEKCGTRTKQLRDFSADIRRIVADDNLPDYTMALVNDPSSEVSRGLRAAGLKPQAGIHAREPTRGIMAIFRPRPAAPRPQAPRTAAGASPARKAA